MTAIIIEEDSQRVATFLTMMESVMYSLLSDLLALAERVCGLLIKQN